MSTILATVIDDMSWLFDETPEPEDPDTSTWEEFLKLALVGCSVNFGCCGGDMHQVTGIIEQVYVYKEGDSINIKLKDAEISPELPEEREREGVTERHEELVLELETRRLPIIRPNIVVLISGLRRMYRQDSVSGFEWDLGSGFNIGFIFRDK